jgi:hypothetical protein
MPALSEAIKSTRSKHSAPGQYLGYAIQPVRLCFHLLTCPPKANVSLEYLDDVAVHYADGSVLLEQTKSALSQNPLADWANDFWKCIANWLSSVSAGTVSADLASFRLYVTPIKSGTRSAALSQATTQAEVESVLSGVQKTLKKMKKLPSCLSHIENVLNATPEIRYKVISHFQVISSDSDPVDPIRTLLKATVGPNLIDPLCQFAIGRAKETADGLIRSGKTAMIGGDEFKADFRHFVQKNNLPSFLASLTSAPSEMAVASVLDTYPIFVQQLDLIQVDLDDRVRAVSDFLRAAADKSTWSEAGSVFDAGLKEWDDDLVRRHRLVKGEVSDIHADKDPATRGRIVYRQSAQMEPSLEGRSVPGHFVHGCLNALADEKTIGWHPDFQTLLKDKTE